MIEIGKGKIGFALEHLQATAGIPCVVANQRAAKAQPSCGVVAATRASSEGGGSPCHALSGSGSGTDACQHYNWIPKGDYDVLWHDDNYPGSSIQGRVWRLSDYQCSNGVRRTELFVHSEETSGQGQSCGPAGTDYRFCWEGDHDYYSLGCVKLARRPTPSDLGRVDNFVHAYGMALYLLVYS